ncbi:hypothetical protein Tco_0648359 [Tanacetum coccineum]
MYCSIVSVIIYVVSSSSECSSMSENKSSSGELDSTRPGVSKSLLLEQNTLSGFLKGVISSLVELLVMHHLKQRMIDTPYLIDLNTPYRDQYVVLSRRVNTSYLTGEYGVSVDISEHDT